MLGNRDAVAVIAVKDLDTARKFYEGVLGLTWADSMDPEVNVYLSGTSKIAVYKSEFAGTNKATALGWNVGEEVDSVVQSLKKKGVTFEKYDLPGGSWKGDIFEAGEVRTAWFKDPDGNILNVLNR